uniref:Uncharacterized protein n=1 Tax=Octopus bimaculoides TaxID=37653 RepID=A0A0L8HHB3_OCTBM
MLKITAKCLENFCVCVCARATISRAYPNEQRKRYSLDIPAQTRIGGWERIKVFSLQRNDLK